MQKLTSTLFSCAQFFKKRQNRDWIFIEPIIALPCQLALNSQFWTLLKWLDLSKCVCWSFCFELKVLNESKYLMPWVHCASGNVFKFFQTTLIKDFFNQRGHFLRCLKGFWKICKCRDFKVESSPGTYGADGGGQGKINCGASSEPDFIQNYFLWSRMVDFFDNRNKCRKSSFLRQRIHHF